MRVVIVEDSEIIREGLQRELGQLLGVEIVGVAGGEVDAIDCVETTQPDLIILDLGLMPGSGVRVLEQVRASGSLARIVVLTNNATEEYAKLCREMGADAFFDKTKDLDMLFAQVAAWIPPQPDNEVERLRALKNMKILDSEGNEAFDDIVRLVATILDVPIALISLVDSDRQWFLARHGIEAQQTSRCISFCTRTILGGDIMEIPDALEDERFHDNPLVQRDPHIRFYAGVPLVMPGGEALGTLCAIDHRPRTLTAMERRILLTLARSAQNDLLVRHRMRSMETEIRRRQEVENQLGRLASCDPLTGMANRLSMLDHLRRALLHAQRHHSRLAVLYLDLDRFKHINDTLGHEAGDHVLIAVAQRLASHVRSSDAVARLGGDEFAVLLSGVDSDVSAAAVAIKLVEVLAEPIVYKDQRLFVSASIGLAIYPNHGDNNDQLIRAADLAMYHAKKAGGNRLSVFEPAFNELAERKLSIELALREALDRQQLSICFQPQIALQESIPTIWGVEALVRWQHPQEGMIAPERFISVAEERGLITQLGVNVLDMALRQLATWNYSRRNVPRVAVNVSGHQLGPQFTATIKESLARYKVPAHQLELEITESVLSADGACAVQVLEELRALGVSISIDDFGVGYSSLAQLRSLPIDTIKIDRRFIVDVASMPQDAAIVQAIVTMAKALGLRTVAEGVESDEQMQVLRELGCDYVQGFHVTCPQPAQTLIGWLAEYTAMCA